MKRFGLLALITVVGLTGALWAKSPVPGMADARFKTIDNSVEKLVAAYNAGNAQAFLAEFQPGQLQLVDAQARIKKWKGKVGNIKSRTVNAAYSRTTEEMANIAYTVDTDKGQFQLGVHYSPYQGGPDRLVEADLRTVNGLAIP